MRIGTCNSQNNPDLPRKKVRKIARIAGRNTDICGFQEIREAEDVLDTQRGLGDKFDLVNENVSVPIGYRKNIFNVLESGFVLASPKGKGFTPDRYVSYAVFEHRKRPYLEPFAVTNGHLINKGPGNPSWENMGRRLTDEDQARIEYWDQGWEVWDELVDQLVGDGGYSTFCVGDFNKLHVKKFDPEQRWLAGDNGIDKIAFIPVTNATHFKTEEVHKINTPSDHHLRVVRGKLR